MHPLSNQVVSILSLGSFLPQKILHNSHFESFLDTSHAWISSRTGISQRHISDPHESTSFMASQAALNALSSLPSRPHIDALVLLTMSGDLPFPSTACLTQSLLNLPTSTFCFDINAACSGYIYGLQVAKSLLLANPNYQNILLVASERLSKLLDWSDRSTAVLFGDGAAATLLSKSTSPYGIIDIQLHSDGSKSNLLFQPAGGTSITPSHDSIDQKLHFLKMNGKELFKYAVKYQEDTIRSILSNNNLSISDIDHIVPHQANIRIIEALADRLQLPLSKFVTTIHQHGNTSASSIPLALHHAHSHKRFLPGQKILLVAFGAGLTWGSVLLKWSM